MNDDKNDCEVQAIQTLVSVLSALDADQRSRVIAYVCERYGLAATRATFTAPSAAISKEPTLSAEPGPASARVADIRALKEEKSPRSAVEMAAVVAYYLSELAPQAERKGSTARQDIEKYFKQAGYRLPQAPQQTLPNAAAAGYFTNAGHGKWTLNPVGYNLVAHGLPSKGASERGASKRTKKKSTRTGSAKTAKKSKKKVPRKKTGRR